MSGKRAFIELLKQEGVKFLFGNPGTTELPLMDAFAVENELRYVLGLHEGAVMSMADGYAQASGRLAAVNLHVAPGLGNAMGMLYDAQKSGAPILVTAGQQDQSFSVTEPFLWADLPPIARPFVKWSAEVRRLADLPRMVHRAAKTALAPPTGPVFLSLPGDILNAEDDIELGAPTRVAPSMRADAQAIEAAAALLAAAERPVIIAGAAVAQRRAHRELVELAELLGAPVFAEGVANTASFPASHPLFRGTVARLATSWREALSEYDLLFSVGGDLFTLSLPSGGESVPAGLKIIHLDIDAWELGKNYSEAVALLGDPAATLPELTRALGERMTADARARARVRCEGVKRTVAAERAAIKAQAKAAAAKAPIQPLALLAALGEMLPADTVVVDETLSSGAGLRRLLKSDDPQSYYGLGGGGIGWGLPAAIGVKLALPERAGGGPYRRRQRHVQLPGAVDGGALPHRGRLRHLQQPLLPHPQAAGERAQGPRGAKRRLCRHGPRRSRDRLRRPGTRARHQGRARRDHPRDDPAHGGGTRERRACAHRRRHRSRLQAGVKRA